MQTNDFRVSKVTGNLSTMQRDWAAAAEALQELLLQKTETFKVSIGAPYSEVFKRMALVSQKSAIWLTAHIIIRGRSIKKTAQGKGPLSGPLSTAISEMDLFTGAGSIGKVSIDFACMYLASLMCYGKKTKQDEIIPLPGSHDLPIPYRWVGSIGVIPIGVLAADSCKMLKNYDAWLQDYIKVRRRENTVQRSGSMARTRSQYLRLINSIDEDSKTELWEAITRGQEIKWVTMNVKDENAYLSDMKWQAMVSQLP